MPDHFQVVIRALEIEAEMNEAEATKCSQIASCMSESQNKRSLEALARESREKAAEIRHQIELLRDSRDTPRAS